MFDCEGKFHDLTHFISGIKTWQKAVAGLLSVALYFHIPLLIFGFIDMARGGQTKKLGIISTLSCK